MPFTRGFRSRGARDPRLPPGQYDAGAEWPVLNAEATPTLSTDSWTFVVEGLVEQPTRWTWEEIHALPDATYAGDIHCVTTWSRLGVTFRGRVPGHAVLRRSSPALGHPHRGLLLHGLYDQPSPGRRYRGKGLGNLGVRGVAPAGRARGTRPSARPPPIFLEERQVGVRDPPTGPR